MIFSGDLPPDGQYILQIISIAIQMFGINDKLIILMAVW